MNIKELPIDTRLIQLAEEAAELSQAAIKYVRVLRGETPVTKEEALKGRDIILSAKFERKCAGNYMKSGATKNEINNKIS